MLLFKSIKRGSRNPWLPTEHADGENSDENSVRIQIVLC